MVQFIVFLVLFALYLIVSMNIPVSELGLNLLMMTVLILLLSGLFHVLSGLSVIGVVYGWCFLFVPIRLMIG